MTRLYQLSIGPSNRCRGAATAHLAASKAVFLPMVENVRSFLETTTAECIAHRDYEALERIVLEHLLGC